MSHIPENLLYTRTHEWVHNNGDGTVTVGITDHAQDLLGDMVFIELPEIGTTVDREEEVVVVESVKAASDVYAPVGGEIVAVNERLTNAPELVNKDAYDDGWMMKIRVEDKLDLDELLSSQDYQELLEEEQDDED